MRHLSHFLGKYDKYLVAPSGTSVQRPGYTTVYFPPKFFGSAAAHNRLLLWPYFYRTFLDYEYILVYHLDSLVLSDELMKWCQAGWDYIGAPWIPCDDSPWVKEPAVGNGGFTLMKVSSILQVLHNRHCQEPMAYWSDMLTRNGARLRLLFRILESLEPCFPNSRLLRRVVDDWRGSEEPARHGKNNDYFWSFDASEYLPEFKVAPVDQGLQFAFEAAPRICFELNQRRLPFGCHAWAKYDRKFWLPHLLVTSDELQRGLNPTRVPVESVPRPFTGTLVSRRAGFQRAV